MDCGLIAVVVFPAVMSPVNVRTLNIKKTVAARKRPQSVAKVYLTKSFIRVCLAKGCTIAQMYDNVHDLQKLYLIIIFK